MYACVNELNEARARNWALSCSIVFNYSYFLDMVLASIISTIPHNAWVMIRGQHSLRTNQWNHPVLGCVTGGDTFFLPTHLLTERRASSSDCASLIEWESLTDGSSPHCLLNSSLVGGDLSRRYFRAFAVKEGLSVISWLPGDCPNHEGRIWRKYVFEFFFSWIQIFK